MTATQHQDVPRVAREPLRQTDWPDSLGLAAENTLVSTLLQQSHTNDADRIGVANRLASVVGLAASHERTMPVAICGARLPSESGRFDQADQTRSELKGLAAGSPVREPQVLA